MWYSRCDCWRVRTPRQAGVSSVCPRLALIVFLRPAKRHRGAVRYHDESLAGRSTVRLMEVREGVLAGRPAGRPSLRPADSPTLVSCCHLACPYMCFHACAVLMPTHFTVYAEKMNQLTVADVLFSPDFDVLHSSAMFRSCPCVPVWLFFSVLIYLFPFF